MNPFKIKILVYHYVRDKMGDFPYLNVRSISDFQKQVTYLKSLYTVLSWRDLKHILKGESQCPDNACLLTFDDGLRDHYDNVFPVLKREGVSGLFFVIARRTPRKLCAVHIMQLLLGKLGGDKFTQVFFKSLSVGERKKFEEKRKVCLEEFPPDRFGEIELRTVRRVINAYLFRELEDRLVTLFNSHVGDPETIAPNFYLSESQMREMFRAGMHFGSHGVTHYRLDRLTDEEAQGEITESARFLEKIEQGPFALAYPYGNYEKNFTPFLRQAGFICAFTGNESDFQTDPMNLGRFDTVHVPLQ